MAFFAISLLENMCKEIFNKNNGNTVCLVRVLPQAIKPATDPSFPVIFRIARNHAAFLSRFSLFHYFLEFCAISLLYSFGYSLSA